MRGASSLAALLVAGVLFLPLLTSPVTAGVATTNADAPGLAPAHVPDPAACASECDLLVEIGRLIDRTPVERLPATLLDATAPALRDAVPRPDHLPGYDGLADADKRGAWRVWAAAVVMAGVSGSGPWFGPGAADTAAQGDAGKAALDAPHGLTNLWRVEAHGHVREVLAANDDGATFLATSAGVLRFEAPGAAPSWMVKPGGYVSKVATTDANGDGTLDIVVGTMSFRPDNPASVTILDGLDGSVIFRGLGGAEHLFAWELSDIDGDGQDEIVGLDVALRVSGFELDGTRIYGVPVLDVPSTPPVFLFLVLAWFIYYPVTSQLFADANGDGVPDVVVSSLLFWIVSAFVVGSYGSVPMLSVYDGRDGSTVWHRTLEPSEGFGWIFGTGSGDLTGDGRDDIALYRFSFYSAPSVVPGFVLIVGQETYSGLAGEPVARDQYHFVCPLLCVSTYGIFSTVASLGFADLDDDGAEELLTVEYGTSGAGRTLDVVARGAPPVGFLGTMELYRVALEAPAERLFGGSFSFRDLDADGDLDLLARLAGFEEDAKGVATELRTAAWRVTAAGAEQLPAPELFARYDVNPVTGDAYAWIVPEDRWVPLDDTGAPAARGLRLVPSAVPVWTHEMSGDGVPDLLLRKQVGFMWVDGRSGALLDDVVRPSARMAVGLVEERGTPHVVERSLDRSTFTVAPLDDEDLWSFRADWARDVWSLQFGDVTGDGRTDLALEHLDCCQSGYVQELRVVDGVAGEVVMHVDLEDAWQFQVSDVARNRTGDEVVLVRNGDVEQVQAFVPEVDGPLWTHQLGESGELVAAADGMVAVQMWAEGLVVRLVDGDDGHLLGAHKVSADAWFPSAVRLTDLDGDGAAEAVIAFQEYSGSSSDQRVAVYGRTGDAPVSEFSLGPPETHTVMTENQAYHFRTYSNLRLPMGDWDGDGLADLSFEEGGVPTVRALADGRVLAVAPVAGSVVSAPDLNGDGVAELAVLTKHATLRSFASADADVMMEPESDIEVILDPESLQGGSKVDFFAEERSALPSIGFVWVALAMLALAFVARRRSG